MDRRLKLRHFQCFLEAARSPHQADVAQTLNITQAAVSKTLTELESIVGEKLLIRDRSGIQLTSQGELFFHYASAGMASFEKGYKGVMADPLKPCIELRIGVLPTVAARIMPKAVNEFLVGNKRSVNLSLETGYNSTLLGMLHGGTVDLVVARIGSPEQMQELEFSHLYTEPLVLVARSGHPLFEQKESRRLKSIGEYPFLLPPAATRIRPIVTQALNTMGITVPDIILETVSNTFGRSFLPVSDAVWMISYGVVGDFLEAGSLRLLTDPIENTSEPVGLIRRRDQEVDVATRNLTNILLAHTRHLRPLDR